MSDTIDQPTGLAVIQPATISTIVAADTDGILASIARKVAAFRPDISTKAGREEMRSLAYEIAKSKSELIRIGKGLTEGWRKQTKSVNAECAIIEERMDELRNKVRAPLTAWENQEKQRVADHETALVNILSLGEMGPEPTLFVVVQRIEDLDNLPDRDWQEFSDRAADAIIGTRVKLTKLRTQVEQRDAERAELARLRAAEEERQREEAARRQREHEMRIAAEAADRARQAAEAEAARLLAEERMRAAREAQESERRLADERAQAERAAQAAEQARLDAERRADKALADAREAVERAERERIAAEQKAEADRAQAQQEAIWERDRAIAAEQKRMADNKAAAETEEQRCAANKTHRAKIMGAIKIGLMSHADLDEEQARRVVLALVNRQIAHVVVEF
jgi:hypothetical protein